MARSIVLVLLLAGPVLAAPAQSVGTLGDPGRFEFTGNATFSTEHLRSALAFDLSILVAGHPDTSLGEFVAIVQRRVAEGYEHSGFAVASVRVRVDDERQVLVIDIDEGPRSRAGNIEVIGARTLPVEAFQQRVRSPRIDATVRKPSGAPSSKPALWTPGKPVSFSTSHWRGQREEFQKILNELGYYDTVLQVGVRAEPDDTATLVVTIEDEGPRATLGEFEILGADRNSVEDVIRFLDLPLGTVLDAERKEQIEKRLRDCGRYLKHDLEIVTPPIGDAPSILRIRLVELPGAPRLEEPLTEKQQVLVRLAAWLNTLEETDHDLELRAVAGGTTPGEAVPPGSPILHARAVISQQNRACLLQVRAVVPPDRELVHVWAHLHPQGLELGSPRHGLKFEGPAIALAVRATAGWTAHAPDAQGRMTSLQFGVGADSNTDGTRPPFTLDTKVAAAAALREAIALDRQLVLQDGILTARTDTAHFEVDAETGRLITLRINQGPTLQQEILARKGLFREALGEFQSSLKGARTVYAGDVPLSNFLAFLTQCLPEPAAVANPSTQTAITLAHRLLKRGGFHALDRLFVDFFTTPKDKFNLPGDARLAEFASRLSWHSLILPFVRQLTPPPSWTWTLAREFAFLPMASQPRKMQILEQLLATQETGPVCSLASAVLMGLHHPALKAVFARRGLTRLERHWFEQDCEPLMNAGTPVGKLAQALAQTLQEADLSELRLLTELLPLDEDERTILVEGLASLSANPQETPLEGLRRVLNELWQPLLRPRLETVLRQLSQPEN